MSFGLVLPFVLGNDIAEGTGSACISSGRHGGLPLHVDRAFIGKKLPEIIRNYSQK